MNGNDAVTQALKKARRRRGMYLLPSLFTVGNIGAGYFAIMRLFAAISGRLDAHIALDQAALAILIAIPFDALDGRIARMTNTTSEFGKELDSLADAITFGVAPSLLAYIWGFHYLPTSVNADLRQNLIYLGGFVCFLFLIGGVSRLARFNISHNPVPRNPGRPDRKYFVGMPIPAAAGLLATGVHFCMGYPNPAWWVSIVWLVLVGVCGFLMVSTWRFWSGKEINLSSRHPFQILPFIAIALFLLIFFSQVVLFAGALVYMFSGIWARAAYSWSRRRRQRPTSALESPDPLSHS
ncbi:MAG TPA: phosphatidylcholine/phosphatidylserine synthase [Candidatus Binataceae bacterium]